MPKRLRGPIGQRPSWAKRVTFSFDGSRAELDLDPDPREVATPGPRGFPIATLLIQDEDSKNQGLDFAGELHTLVDEIREALSVYRAQGLISAWWADRAAWMAYKVVEKHRRKR